MKAKNRCVALRAWSKRFFPWLLLAVVGLLCAAGTGVYMFLYQPAQPTAESLSIVPSDTFNLLLALTDPDSHEPLAFLLMGLDAPDKQLTFMPLPGTLAVQQDKTLTDLLNGRGATEATAACASKLGVPIDYYWVQDGSVLAQMVDLYGGVDCSLPAAASINIPHGAQVQTVEGPQHLNGVKVEAATCYAVYPRVADKLAVEGNLFQALFRQKCTAQNLDPDSFGSFFDLVKTNFSMNDLLSKGRGLWQAASPSGQINVLQPSFQASHTGALELTPADQQKIIQIFGKQKRQYGH